MIYYINFIFPTPKPPNGGLKTKYILFNSTNTASKLQFLALIWGFGGQKETYHLMLLIT